MGVVAARLDRLQPSARRVLQEASVIGKTFIADLLGSITSEPSYESSLDELQKLDLVRVYTFEPRLEYEFKHALIQDVAYAGLLRQERVELHERVGSSLESLFSDRLPEAYETLALHFSRGISTEKAVHYLRKSAEKSFERYAVEESDEFYSQAFELLAATPQSGERDEGLVRILNGWGYVIYDRGEMAELLELLESHQNLAESLGVAREHAMFCVTLAIAMHCSERFEEAVASAGRGLEMAEQLGDEHVAACARVWLAYGVSELGRPRRGPRARRARHPGPQARSDLDHRGVQRAGVRDVDPRGCGRDPAYRPDPARAGTGGPEHQSAGGRLLGARRGLAFGWRLRGRREVLRRFDRSITGTLAFATSAHLPRRSASSSSAGMTRPSRT